jgi:multidrug efflux pump subunit AcrA (membrane-fusion protein)
MVLPGQSVLYRSTEDLEAGASFVWLYDPKTQTAVSRNVVVGELVQDGIEVISGIKANDQVIIKGGSRLSEGEKVSIKRERS